MTMAEVPRVPRLLWLAKRVVKQCYGCKRFQAQPLHYPSPGHLLKSRTEGSTLFDVIGVDFAGHMKHDGKCEKEEKA